jgi:hypothetical protein
MKNVLLYSLLLFLSFYAKAQSLRWLDIERKNIYRIDFKKTVVEKSSNAIDWQEIGKAELKNIKEKDILVSNEIKCLNTDDKNLVYLLMECTNQVYQFNYQTLLLERIDKTYFGGFNCRSTKFIRQNTIYSVGGYGLYRSNNLFVYYLAKRNEWDAINFSNDAPKSIFKGLSGYEKKTDSFFTGLNDFVSSSENSGKGYTDYGFYEYKFKNNKWNKLGEIKQTLLRKIKKTDFQYFHWNGKYFVFRLIEKGINSLFIIDPTLNEVYQWIDENRLFHIEIPTELEKEYVHEDSLQSYKFFDTGNRNERQKIAISIEETKNQAVYIGKLYESENNNFLLIFISIGIGLLIISFIIYYKFIKDKSSKQHVLFSSFVFNSLEIKMIEALINNHENGGIRTLQINELLGISNKSVDNQRKIRHQFIKSLDLKLKKTYKTQFAIEKYSSTADKRIFIYQLNEVILNKLRKEIENSNYEFQHQGEVC